MYPVWEEESLRFCQIARQQVSLPEPPTRRGRPRKHARRLVLNAILYVLRGRIAWRLMPAGFPPWPSVYA